jgi:hypothetical protein
MRKLMTLLACVLAVSGVGAVDGSEGPVPAVTPASQDDDHTVIAVVDTGINMSHSFFSAPALTDHPSTWLPGFPAGATSVHLTLDAPDLATALDADKETWAGVQRSTVDGVKFDAHLYTFPGTRVIGAVSFGELQQPPDVEPIPIFDHYGHGTHSAGLVAGANLPSSDGNVLIVMVEAGLGDFENGIRWAARQPWIDALSLSLGSRAGLPFAIGASPLTTSATGTRTGVEWATHEAAVAGKPVFMASGNGLSGTTTPPDHCSTYTSPYTGPTWVTRIGAADPGSGNPTWWHCLPVDVIARTNVGSPAAASLNGWVTAIGTSASTPNVAGHFARLLLQSRRDDRQLTAIDVRDHLLRAAEPAEFTPAVGAEPSLDAISFFDQGYGLVDADALERAMASLAAGAPRPRPELDQWWTGDTAIREALWNAETGLLMTDARRRLDGFAPPQNDAGAGRDAPNDVASEVEVRPGVVYRGMVGGTLADLHDFYWFTGAAGDAIHLKASGYAGGVEITDVDGGALITTQRTALYGLAAEIRLVLPADGIYYIHYENRIPDQYTFSFAIGADAPDLPTAPL